MNQIFQVGFKPAPENYEMILDAIIDAIKQYKPKRIEVTDDLQEFLIEHSSTRRCEHPYVASLYGIPVEEYLDADIPYSYKLIDIENEPKLFGSCFAKLESNSTYVIEIDGHPSPKQLESYLHWLESLAGNGIKFVPSTKSARIVRGN